MTPQGSLESRDMSTPPKEVSLWPLVLLAATTTTTLKPENSLRLWTRRPSLKRSLLTVPMHAEGLLSYVQWFAFGNVRRTEFIQLGGTLVASMNSSY